MTGPANAVLGDENFGTDIPEMAVDTTQMEEERQMAQYAKSGEFQRIRDHFNQRIQFYQSFLPDGRSLTDGAAAVTAEEWKVANLVIGELKMIMAAYDSAQETVDARP